KAGHAIALLHAGAFEESREAAREPRQLVEGQRALGPALAEPSQRRPARARVARDDRVGEVDGTVMRPAERIEAVAPREARAGVLVRRARGALPRQRTVSRRRGVSTRIAWISGSEKPRRRIIGTTFAKMWP